MATQGLFIVLEGSDGSGKATQLKLLKERLKAIGYDVSVYDFPRYNQESSYFVRQYLAGNYGPASKINPYTASLFYALDRFEAAKDIRTDLKQGKIVLSNRYVGSNMAHQGSKFEDPVEQRGFFVWEDNLEFQLLNIPRPNISFFLRVPAGISRKLIEERAAKLGKKLDEHEKDIKFLKKSLKTYDVLCQLFPKDFKAVECSKDGQLLSVAGINNILWEQLKPMMPRNKPHPSHSVVVTLGLAEESTKASDGNLSSDFSQKIKNASLLLQLEVKRSSQSVITPEFVSWADSSYSFYTPQGLPRELENKYKTTISHIAELHKRIRQKLSQYMERHLLDEHLSDIPSINYLMLPLTPLCAIFDFEIRLKKSSVTHLTSRLLTNDEDELQWVAKQLYIAARQKWPEDFKESLESRDNPELINSIITKLAEERLPKDYSSNNSIKLLEVHPRLEFDLLAESIYPYSSLSHEEIADEVSDWPYVQKFESLREAASQPEILKKVRYKMDIISDQIALNNIIAKANMTDVQVQAFTPRYGFDVPEIIEDAMVDDLYNKVFDESLKLYSLMQGGGREDLAPYATLLGHKLRWQLDVNAHQLKEIFQLKNASHNNLIEEIIEQIITIHPLLWEVILGSKAPVIPQHKNGKNRVKPVRQTSKKTSKKKRP